MRGIYERLPHALKNIMRSAYYKMPGTMPWRRDRWIRDVYTRTMHEQRRRIFVNIAHYCHINRPTEGYYFEFGVHGANTMRMAYDNFRHLFDFTYVAFDSFSGLPAIAPIDRQVIWEEGKLRTSEGDFRRVCEAHGIPANKLLTVPGFYENSLNEETANRLGPKKAAVIYVDCDLYESTVPVLHFIKGFLQVGTVLVFDDWNCFHGDPERGERRAFAEFRATYPNLRFEPFFSVGMQSSFICVGI